MYKITPHHIQGYSCLHIENNDGTTALDLCLSQGGRLSKLKFDSLPLLADYDLESYKENYASAILFPFANRIKDGKYSYGAQDHQLVCNEVALNNALHGLVYDRTFELVDQKLSNDEAQVILCYDHLESAGFPYSFNIKLVYTLRAQTLSLKVMVANTGNARFPFVLGWHPYFLSDDLHQSALHFDTDTKYALDNQMIVCGKESCVLPRPWSLDSVKLDDAYLLKTSDLTFDTPSYQLQMDSEGDCGFLQLYTPETPGVIAIEPMTGAPDAFNNLEGIQDLEPGQFHEVTWKLHFKRTDFNNC